LNGLFIMEGYHGNYAIYRFGKPIPGRFKAIVSNWSDQHDGYGPDCGRQPPNAADLAASVRIGLFTGANCFRRTKRARVLSQTTALRCRVGSEASWYFRQGIVPRIQK